MTVVDGAIAVVAEQHRARHEDDLRVAGLATCLVDLAERRVCRGDVRGLLLAEAQVGVEQVLDEHDRRARAGGADGVDERRHALDDLLRCQIREGVQDEDGRIQLGEQAGDLGFGLAVAREAQVDHRHVEPASEHRGVAHARARRTAPLGDRCPIDHDGGGLRRRLETEGRFLRYADLQA